MRLLRFASGKQQRELAAAIECDPSQVSKVECGERLLETLEVQALLDFLDATPAKRDELLAASPAGVAIVVAVPGAAAMNSCRPTWPAACRRWRRGGDQLHG
ncbi:helix-turn-helix domain-containing protein [Amycolatopsis sp. NPDC059657]|uniref:helix-turn-helix domain-containing protein n=1 Tax=Amycolatopsis sp. NPDC059657 TaxID=3346899 RepID=UPI00366E23A6